MFSLTFYFLQCYLDQNSVLLYLSVKTLLDKNFTAELMTTHEHNSFFSRLIKKLRILRRKEDAEEGRTNISDFKVFVRIFLAKLKVDQLISKVRLG
jgi:hypothetical protein